MDNSFLNALSARISKQPIAKPIILIKSYQDLLQIIFKKHLIIVIVSGLLVAMCNLGISMLASYLFANTASGNTHYLINILLGTLFILIGMAIFTFFSDLSVRILNINLSLNILPNTVNHILLLPLKVCSSYSAGDLSQRINEFETDIFWLPRITLAIMFDLFSLVFLLGYMTYCNIILAIIFLAVASLYLFLKIMIFPGIVRQLQLQFAERGKLSSFLNEVFLQIHKIRTANIEGAVFYKWLIHLVNIKKFAEASLRREVIFLLLETSLPLLLILLIFLKVYFNPNDNVILTLQFMLCAGQFSALFDKLSDDIVTLMHFIPCITRLRPLLEATPEITMPYHPGKGEVEFSDVSFKHADTNTVILNKLNLKIHAGEFIGIIGASGSGKSTIFKLLLGLEQPTSGLITNINRKKFGVVLQNSNLFPGTILSNLTTNKVLSLDEAWELAKAVGLDDDVQQMPMKMFTFVSDNAGESISGGQKQKILLARALANQPEILLLDEATSALDNNSEKKVYAYLEKLNITRIMIAHRVSSLQGADRVFEMREGSLYLVDADNQFP